MSFSIEPLDAGVSIKMKAYRALKSAITRMDIYSRHGEIRLDERQLCERLGVSRTPVREALALLEQEGLVRSSARRGVFVVRKTKAEIVEMIVCWAALEGMAARLVAERASEQHIQALWDLFRELAESDQEGHRDEYSDANIAFHQAIIRASGSAMIADLTENLFMHVRAIRSLAIRQEERAARSLVEHRQILEALQDRDPELAERLVRDHTLGLATHVEKHCDFLD